MKRLYIAAAVGLCWGTSGRAQEGALAPTVPVVPAPVLQNGNLVAPASGAWGTTGPRLFSRTRWALTSAPSAASDPGLASGYTSGYVIPPLPSGVGGQSNTPCGPSGCGHGGMSWARLKAWLCYRPSKTELPMFRPTPYVTPLQGMFSCTSGCGCAGGSFAGGYSPPQQPPFSAPPPPVMPQAVPPPGATGSASAVLMPPRGGQGAAVRPTWQGQMSAAPTGPGIPGYRFATPENQANRAPQGPVVSAGYQPGQK